MCFSIILLLPYSVLLGYFTMLERLTIPWAWTAVVVVFIIAQTACVTKVANATKMHYIHWNTSNPIFRIDNTDHIIDVNKGNIPFEYDQVNIICPVYSENTREEEAEKYIIYNVSKEEYDTCRITNPSPRIIAVCDKPYKLMYFTITFRSFTPQPGGLEFKPGQDYYFISTSSKDDLHQRIGGRCTTHNMKVVFKVCCDPASQPAHDQANGHLPSNGMSTPRNSSSTTSTTTKSSSVSATPKSSSTSTTTTTTTTMQSTTSPKTTTSHKSTGTHTKSSEPKAAGTKKESSNKNEAVKNELTNNSSSGSSLSTFKSWHFGLPFRVWLTIGLVVLTLRSTIVL